MEQFKNLDKLFDVPSTVTPRVELPITITQEDDDYQTARNTIKRILLKGESTLDEILNIARNSEHPRTYEVAGQLIKTMSEVSKDLMVIQKQMKEIEIKSKSKQINRQTNNVFVGSTEELIKLLRKEESKIIEQ